MKKNLLLLLASTVAIANVHAAVHVVQVANFQFSPSNVAANVGDVIRFQWSSGFHTTTSTIVPGGASTWDNPINSNATSFDYTLQVQGNYEYVCSFHGGMTGTLTVGAALPVKFGDLLTQENAAGSIAITWQSFTESNLAAYTIMRSVDGSNFSEIGKVQVKSANSASNQYSFTDEMISRRQQFYYYYVAASDRDGKKTLSAVKLHRTKSSNTEIIASISPNPVSRAGHLNLKFNALSAGKIQFTLFDNAGRLVKQTLMQAVPGVNSGHWHIGELAAGKYVLHCQLGNVKETKEIIVAQ